MMLLLTRGSSSSSRRGGGSGSHAQVDPRGMGMVSSRSMETCSVLHRHVDSAASARTHIRNRRRRPPATAGAWTDPRPVASRLLIMGILPRGWPCRRRRPGAEDPGPDRVPVAAWWSRFRRSPALPTVPEAGHDASGDPPAGADTSGAWTAPADAGMGTTDQKLVAEFHPRQYS